MCTMAWLLCVCVCGGGGGSNAENVSIWRGGGGGGSNADNVSIGRRHHDGIGKIITAT